MGGLQLRADIVAIADGRCHAELATAGAAPAPCRVYYDGVHDIVTFHVMKVGTSGSFLHPSSQWKRVSVRSDQATGELLSDRPVSYPVSLQPDALPDRIPDGELALDLPEEIACTSGLDSVVATLGERSAHLELGFYYDCNDPRHPPTHSLYRLEAVATVAANTNGDPAEVIHAAQP